MFKRNSYNTTFPGSIGVLVQRGTVHPQDAFTLWITIGTFPLFENTKLTSTLEVFSATIVPKSIVCFKKTILTCFELKQLDYKQKEQTQFLHNLFKLNS